MNPLKLLTIAGTIEAISFLLLLGVAMPLKYVAGLPQMVSVVGMGHGLLFIAYVAVLIAVSLVAKLPWWSIPAGFVAAVLPFGPFVYDNRIRAVVKSA